MNKKENIMSKVKGTMAATMTDTHPSPQSLSWEEALDDWRIELTTRVAPHTVTCYLNRIGTMRRWVDAQGGGIALADFRARHLSRYLVSRIECGVKDITRRHDAIACRQFLKWCGKNEYLPGDPLAGYQIPKASRPYTNEPSDDQIKQLLRCVQERWKPAGNPAARFASEPARAFYSRRNYAIVAGLLETGCRAGELLALRLDDYRPGERQVAFRETKGKEARIVPISPAWTACVETYLKKRPKCDSPLLFVNVYGDAMNTHMFGRQLRGYMAFAGLSGWTMHGLRHYALTRMAQVSLMGAMYIAGHKDPKTTRGYLYASAEFKRDTHTQAAPLARLLVNARSEKAKRKKLV
jgi:site-specific recombinase XerD